MADDAQTKLQQDFGGLSEVETLLAAAKMQAEFLSDTQDALAEFDSTPQAEKIFGLKSEIAHALELAKQNLAATLQKIPEHEIERLRREGILSEFDFTEAIKTKRELELSRGEQPSEKDLER